MKQKDLALLAGILVFSVVISLVISHVVFSSSKTRQEKVEIVDKISPDFPVDQVKGEYFNNQSNDPTQLIEIGNPNQHPFAPDSNGQ